MALFQSKFIREVSEEVKALVAASGQGSQLKRRDPAMYGDHHKCNVCSEQAKYIAKDTHWCRKCLDDVDYPHLKDKTLEERQAIQTAALAKIGKSSGHSFSSATGKGDDSPGGSSSGGIGFGR